MKTYLIVYRTPAAGLQFDTCDAETWQQADLIATNRNPAIGEILWVEDLNPDQIQQLRHALQNLEAVR
jgi:hypothetical protein